MLNCARVQSGAIVAALALSSVSYATVLTFDYSNYANATAIPQTYGDRVTNTSMTYGADPKTYSYGSAGGFTPNVQVAYRTFDDTGDSSLTSWNTGYGDLQKVGYIASTNSTGYSIVFTADPGYMVTLSTFELAAFGGSTLSISMDIYDDRGLRIGGLTSVGISGTTHSAFGSGATASYIRLDIGLSGLSRADYIGIDNIQFSQSVAPVPEPATLGILGSSLLLLGRRRK